MSLCAQLTDAERDAIDVSLAGGLLESRVPRHLWPGLVRYFVQGILPGGFLQAVLGNDLLAAVQRADPTSFLGLRHLLDFLMEHAPAGSWGSRDAVIAWTTTLERLEI